MTDFLPAYMEYHRAFCDAPDEYGEFAGLAVLATAIGNKGFVRTIGRRLYPNLWVMLLGPSGRVRKSGAIDVATDLLRSVGKIVYPSEFSLEALLGYLSANPCGLFAWREYKAIASQWANQSYAAGAKALLADLYDSPKEYKRVTQKDGEVTIQQPSLSILAASSFDWFYDSLQSGDCGGGWLARFVIVPAQDRTRFISLVSEPPDLAIRDRAKDALAAVMTWEAELGMTSQARAEFMRWELDFDRRASKLGESAAMMYRLGPAALKIAFLEARGRLATIIDRRDVDRAIDRIDRIAGTMLGFYAGDGAATGNDAVNRRKTLDVVNVHKGGMSRAQLLTETGLGVRALDMALETLLARGDVMRLDGDADPEKWKPGIWYLPGSVAHGRRG